MTHRGTSNKNCSGNSYDRRRRREWLIATFGIPRQRDGRRTRVRCVHCAKTMRAHGRRDRKGSLRFAAGSLRFTWEVDRIICGHAGGRYRRANLQISCPRCNGTRCAVARCRYRSPQTRRHVAIKRAA